MENSVDSVTVHSNSPDREFGTKGNSIIQILCNMREIKNPIAAELRGFLSLKLGTGESQQSCWV